VCGATPGRRSADFGATSLHTLVQMVAGGMGVTLLPKIAADAGAGIGADVAVRHFAEPVVGRSIGVAWREGGPREDEARLLANVLRENLF
ncbi:MAG: LysR substrate-binding domain-containing protein, partial [Hyphomonadaceae bacterium]